MNPATPASRHSDLGLLTDLYQITMAYAYWKSRRHDTEAVFHLFHRANPFQGGYTIACGMADALAYLARFGFAPDDLAYLATLRGHDGHPLFPDEFLDYLGTLRLQTQIHAVQEGTAVFPHAPMLRVQGPILQCQLIETALLNIINFQTLIATKASRITLAAKGAPVLEFGLRRAQGIDGGLAASRAAYVGGADATSNVLAGKLYRIPVRGTHAHSWVMSFENELDSFLAYADALPNNAVFLVDTYATLDGVRNAIRAGTLLRERGHDLAGIRLDSGDLAYLSVEARKLLDAAGFHKAQIVASNDLDEHLIHSLRDQGAAIDVWGVGTRLVTGHDQPALGGVYKLAAIRNPDGSWSPRVKVSEQAAKTSIPGVLQVRRFTDPDGLFVADAICDATRPLPDACTIVDPTDPTRRKHIKNAAAHHDLLQPLFLDGQPAAPPETLDRARDRAKDQLARLHPAIKRFLNPHGYPVGLERGLHNTRHRLTLRVRPA